MEMVQVLTGHQTDVMYVFLNNVGMDNFFMLTLLGVFALVFGSFVSAVTYRIPKGLGFVSGRSFCDSCKKELRWYDNVPLISFLLYRGASRCCGKKISIRYPLIELSSLIGAITLFYLLTFYQFILMYLLFLVLLAILVIDLEHQIIPDELNWIVLILAIFVTNGSLITSLFSAFLLSFLLLFLHIITQGRGMGLGDVKLAIPLGLILGLEKGICWLVASFILGGIVASVLLILKRVNLKTKIAFGPFLIVGFWIIILMDRLNVLEKLNLVV
jgi:leader peptidase (prepilin peptidase) / N-methyltransferase